MTTPSDRVECERIRGLMPEYSLGGLGRDESASVRAHADACPDCQSELSSYERVVDGLLLTPAPAVPSPGLRGRVMLAAGVVPAAARESLRPGGVLRWLATLLTPSPRLSRLAVAVAVVALAIAAGATYETLRTRSEMARVVADNQSLREQVSSSKLLMADALRPGSLVWELRGTESAPTARASLYCNPDSRIGVLSASDLPNLPRGQAYQVWLIQGGARTSGGLLTTDSSGRGVLTVEAPEPFGAYQAVGVTIEPAGGSQGPTGPRVLAGRIY